MPRRAFAICLAMVALAAPALAAESGVEQFLPGDAMITLCYHGDNPDIDKTALAQLIAEPEVAAWLASVRQALAGGNQLVASFLKVNPAFLRPLLGCQMGVALLPPGAQGPPSALLAARVGKAGGPAREQVAAFIAQAAALAGGVGQKIKMGDMELTKLGPGPAGLFYGFRDDYLLLASSQQTIADALSADVPKLAAHAAWQRAATMTGSPVLLLLYDHNQVMQHFGAMMPREVKAVLAAVGLDEVKSVGLRLGARGRALVGSLFVQTAGERRGLIKAMASAPVDPSLLRLAPRDASIAWASNLDGTELYDATLALIDAVAKAAEPGTNVPALVAQFEGKAGLSLRNDLFASLGRGTLVTTSGESLLPALIVSQAVKDPERFEGAVGKLVVQLDRLIKAHAEPAGAALKTIQFGKHTIRYLATPGVYLPLAPCFVRQGDRIIFALSPVHLKDYLAFLDAGEPSILDNPGYKELAALVPKNATSVSYSDFTESFIDVYTGIGPLLSLVQAIPGNPVPIDLANLPSARTIRKHLFGSISYGYATDDLIVHESQSPLGFGVLGPVPATATVAVGAAIALPALARARTQARTVASLNNMRQITMAIMVYENEHNALPQNLQALIDAKVLGGGGRILVAPDDPGPPQVDGRPCSYVYFLDGHPGVKLKTGDIENPARTPVLWERMAFNRGRRNVAFADGHVESMFEPRFQRALARLKALFEAKGNKKGGQL